MPHRDALPCSRGQLRSAAASPQPAPRRHRIYIGEVVASATPLLLETLLGSCVAVCLHDPVVRIGGMNHILLPGRCPTETDSRCGAQAIDLLLEQVVKSGAARQRLVAKVFGAGNVIAALQAPTVGERNATFIRDYLANLKIPVVAQRLGGNHAVHVQFHTDTGKAMVRSVDGSRLPEILNAEDAYRLALPGVRNDVRMDSL
jgi:chemotaxis protein CheD